MCWSVWCADTEIDARADRLHLREGAAPDARRLDDGWSFSGAFYYQDALQPMDRPLVDYQPVQRRFDIRTAKSFHDSGKWRGEVALTLQNLFDTAYTEYVAKNVFDRHVFATLTLKW